MKKLVKIASWLFAFGSIVLIAGVFYIYTVMVPALPSIDHLEDAQYQVPLRVYDRNEILLAEFGEHRRIPVAFDKIPRNLVDAVVAVEDDQFWNHSGIDFYALLAAAYEVATTGRKTRGGSTITMQVARNFFLSPEQTYSRKFNEILLALKIESELSKEKIMELYLNKIFLGHRSYGISAASQVYYDKPLAELTLAQAAMIAGLPKAPSKYNPVSNPERALIRRNYILGRMRILKYISQDELDMALSEPITAELHKTRTIAEAQYVSELVRAQLYEQYGDEIYRAGLKVYTSIDGELQAVANQSLRRALLDYDRRHGYRGVIEKIDLTGLNEDPFDEDLIIDNRIGGLRKGVVISISEAIPAAEDGSSEAVPAAAKVLISNYEQVDLPFVGGIDWAAAFIDEDNQGPKPEKVGDVLAVGDVIWIENRDSQWLLADVPRIEGALVSLDPADGGIRAMAGGFDYFKNKFNRATQARRQPGSNFKPFIYSAALEKGFTAATIINDAPVVFDDDSLEATWRPENYSGKFYGPTRLREALVKSRNLVSIRILQSIGLRYASSYIQRFGFERENMPYDLSLALGSGTFSPLQMARGYTVFSNGGYLIDPYIISRIESGSGKLLYQHKPLTVCQGCETEDLQALAAAEAEAVAEQEEAEAEAMAKPEPVLEVEAATEPEPGLEVEAPESETAADEPSVAEQFETTAVNGEEQYVAIELDPIEGVISLVGETSATEAGHSETRYAPRVISAQNAFIMRSMMREVVQRGTAVRAKELGRNDIAGKTGTTNDQIDAWFSGFNDQMVTTTWVGFDNQRKMGRRETGSRAALPMWIDFMKVALEGRPENLQEQPAGLVTVRIDAQTGARADVDTIQSLFEVFREQNAPKELAVVTSTSGSEAAGVVISAPASEEEIVEDIF
ncbi:MAG: penicillin-binding protein 1A [Gammaproteobacteria bacterium]|nr:penicillin-binding protein 1A [Gammaproteobacteria bacterium]MDH3449843.1 penicillin-binding protein 1A [Gammaproteobacteria bacterium]